MDPGIGFVISPCNVLTLLAIALFIIEKQGSVFQAQCPREVEPTPLYRCPYIQARNIGMTQIIQYVAGVLQCRRDMCNRMLITLSVSSKALLETKKLIAGILRRWTDYVNY